MQNAEEELHHPLHRNETSETWFNAAIAMNKPWSEKLHDVKEDVQRGLQNCIRLKKRPA
ncbi:hypothetical protein JFN83_25625 (plasmid) [Enterobacter hormaechei subsp. xiangfangensis]|nr:hypothetical protein JFN83_25625 [Enterobacter hormaechei subsp. xiangfangensis]